LRYINTFGIRATHNQAMNAPMTSSIPSERSVGPVFTSQLLERLDKNGPRYTSYLTADRYSNAFGHEQYREALLRRVASNTTQPLSLYLHIPFVSPYVITAAVTRL
jgi:oxygen-independent coproporphyrinogen III oxidase